MPFVLFFPCSVGRTTSGIGHHVKLVFGLATNTSTRTLKINKYHKQPTKNSDSFDTSYIFFGGEGGGGRVLLFVILVVVVDCFYHLSYFLAKALVYRYAADGMECGMGRETRSFLFNELASTACETPSRFRYVP